MKSGAKVVLVGLLALATVVGILQLGKKTAVSPGKQDSPLTMVANGLDPQQSSASLASPNLKLADPYQSLNLLHPGTPAPLFTAETATGKPVSLTDYMDKKRLIVVFYQGHFCSVCAAQLEGIQADLDKIRGLGAEVLAVSADEATNAQKTLGEHGLDFPVVPDPQHTLIEKFGVANRAKGGIAYPSVYIIGKSGDVEMAYADPQGQRWQSTQMIEWLKAHPLRH